MVFIFKHVFKNWNMTWKISLDKRKKFKIKKAHIILFQVSSFTRPLLQDLFPRLLFAFSPCITTWRDREHLRTWAAKQALRSCQSLRFFHLLRVFTNTIAFECLADVVWQGLFQRFGMQSGDCGATRPLWKQNSVGLKGCECGL